LNHLLHLVLDGHDGLPLAVCLGQRGLELLVGSDQTLHQGRGGENQCDPSVAFTGSVAPWHTCKCQVLASLSEKGSGCLRKHFGG
jgi:hypothetical protein